MRAIRLLLVPLLLLVASATAQAQEEECTQCHSDPARLRAALTDSARSIEPLLVDPAFFADSVHGKVGCTDCHDGFDEHPHPQDAETTQCSDCHDAAAEVLAASVHGTAPEGRTAPSCGACHGVHDVFRPADPRSHLHPLNVYEACGKCHFEVDPATASTEQILAQRYSDDDHARGLLLSGLVVAPTCVSCHGGHDVHAEGDPESRVARQHVAETCGACHQGVLEQYRQSVHHLRSEGAEHRGATCSDCHRPHEIRRPDAEFRGGVIDACSDCHDERGGSFRQSYHGKRASLGFDDRVATCEACHGSHLVLPQEDPRSTVHDANLVATCAQCHEGAHEEFANYLVHADVRDGERYPVLNGIYVTMTGLLIGTLIIGCIHALLWLVRALAAGEWRRPPRRPDERFVRRWPRSYVIYHAALMSCVLLLASTGLPLHYADRPWARNLMDALGGAAAAGWVHRVAAVCMVAMFVVYLVHLGHRLFVKKERGIFRPETTMLPRWKDVQDILGNLRWFLFLGPRPKYGRWTYWEKFDFWAVFWGMFVIGLSGLMLWFPVTATRFVPGWALNAAVIVHGIEALLDIAFIFTVHVFHANLRPDKFPMDTAFLSGRISEQEFRHERPEEYEAALREGRLESLLADPPQRRTRIAAYVIGTCALAVGFFFVVAMVLAVVQHNL